MTNNGDEDLAGKNGAATYRAERSLVSSTFLSNM